MSDELRQLAHAIKALAESNQGIGGVLRAQVAASTETNRYLGKIASQNEQILEQLNSFNGRQTDSERAIRALQSSNRQHEQRIARTEERLGLTADAE
jgi:septal ring factor EnvC (AmiA/AmiB activator)